jgi:hypothetical protein
MHRILTPHRRETLTLFSLILILSIGAVQLDAQQIKFRDYTKTYKVPGYVRNGASCYGHGIALADINNDLIPDIYIASAIRYADNNVPETFYLSGTSGFVECDGTLKITDEYGWTGSHGICFVDYNNDGLLDIYNATTDDLNRLYKNIGTATSPMYQCVNNTQAQQDAIGLPKINFYMPDFDTHSYGYGTRAILAFDANNDGWMDLLGVNWGPAEQRECQSCYIQTPEEPNEFYLNDGDGTFSYDQSGVYGLNGTVYSGGKWVNPYYLGTQGATAVDANNDGWIDVFICHRNISKTSDSTIGYNFPSYQAANNLFMNNGTGHFRDELALRHLQTLKDGKDPNDCNGAAFADYDNDGDLDAFVIPKDGQTFSSVQAYKNLLNETGTFDFENVTKEITTDGLGIKQAGFSIHFLDADNDGDLDIIAPISKSTIAFYINNGSGQYTKQSGTGLEITVYDPRGGGIGDFNGDGLLDIYWADKNKTDDYTKPTKLDSTISNRLFLNQTVTTNHWLKVTGRGPKGDMSGLGSKIWVFDRGYMDDMSHLVGYRQVKNSYGYLAHDDLVQHFGLAQRDTVDVKITLLGDNSGDRTFKVYKVSANHWLYFNMPATLALNDGDGQTADVGQPLPKPLSVRLTYTDVTGAAKPAVGVPVTFSILSGNGSLAQAQPVYTDLQGIAKTNFTLGTTSGEQKVKAVSPMLSSAQFTFTLHAQQSGPAILTLMSPGSPTGTVGSALTDSIKIRVTNTSSEGQANHPVHFEIIAGSGHLFPGNSLSVDRNTNSTGYAAVSWQLGTTVGSQQLRITSLNNGNNLAGSPDTVKATATAGAVTSINKVEGDGQIGTVDSLLVPPLIVKVTDQYGNGVASVSVRYDVTAGDGKIDGAASVVKTTGADGLVSAQWRLGKVAGAEQKVRASLNGNPTLYKDFTATAIAKKAAQMTWLSPETLSGPVNKALPDSLVAKVTDAFGNVVKNFNVIFAVTAGGGLVNGQNTVNIATKASGLAKVQWKLGPTVGTLNNTFTVTATGLTGSPQTVRASGTPEKPYSIAKGPNGGGDQQTGSPLTILPDSLIVVVTDSLGNVYPGQQVVFTVQSGDAFFGAAQTVTRTSNAQGRAIVSVKLGTRAGAIAISASSNYNGKALVNAPLAFSAQLRPGSFDLTKSQITASSPVIANGRARSTINVYVKDNYSNPISGLQIVVQASGDGNTLTQPAASTDPNGLATGYLSSTRAEIKKVWALANVVPVAKDSAQVVFNTASPAFLTKPAGENQTGVIGRLLDNPLVAALADSFGNAIVGANLIVQHQIPGGQVVPLTNLTTDVQGWISISYQLSANAGSHQVIVSYGSLQAIFHVQAALGVAASIEPVSGDGQQALGGTELSSPLIVKVTDAHGDSLLGLPVTFSLITGTGEFVGDNIITTDTHGRAQARFKMGTEIGARTIRASVAGLQQSADFQCSVREAQIKTIDIYAGNQQSTHASRPLSQPLVALLRDELSHSAAGASVLFSVISGGGSINPVSPVITDSDGFASANWTLGADGQQKAKAEVVGLPDKYVLFDASIGVNRPPSIACPTDTTINEMQHLSFSIRASDLDGDEVTFAANNLPSGATFDPATKQFSWTPDYSQAGQHQVTFIGDDGYGGVAPKTSTIKVLNVNRAPMITRYYPPDARIAVKQGDRITFKVWAEDPDSEIPMFYWTINSIKASEKDSFAVIASGNLPDSSLIKVKVTDGDKYVEQSWTLLVISDVEKQPAAVANFTLAQNYPNPFNPTTAIAFSLPRPSHVRLTIFNETGQLVRTLTNFEFQVGSHTLVWDAKNDRGQSVPSGIYYYQMEADGYKEVKKLLLLK